MKRIEVGKWKEKILVDGNIEEKEVNLLTALTILVNNKNPQEMPKGLDNFRIMNRISKAFDEAEKYGVLKLESVDYMFLKNLVEKDIPGNWGRNSDIFNAVEAFLNAKDE